jgi:hypothetical protein
MNLQDEALILSVVAQFCGAVATFSVGLAALNMGKTQTKAALFDHRFGVYRKLSGAVSEINMASAVRDQSLEAIHQCLHAAKFLYSEDIHHDIERLFHEANGARWLAPLEHRTRPANEQVEEKSHRVEINKIWDRLEPKMSKSLSTWKD